MSAPLDQAPPASPGRAMRKRFLLASAIIIALVAAATATAGIEQAQQVSDYLAQSPRIVAPQQLTPDQAGAPQTILIIGSDKRARSTVAQDRLSPPHTDTLLLLRMDPHRAQTSVLSIPRDLEVTIEPYNGPPTVQKINAAYALGGVKLTLSTIERLLHIRINHVIDLNFAAFRQVVDAVGCVYVDVDRRYYHSNVGLPPSLQYSAINVQPGYQRLCGGQALAYVRYRHTDSDFVRVARQQDFIRQIGAQIGINGLLARRDSILRAVGRSIETDIRGAGEIIRLTKLFAFSLGQPLRQVRFRIASDNSFVGGVSYVTATPTEIQATVRDFLRGNEQLRLAGSAGGAGSARTGRRAPRPTTPSAPGLLAAGASDRAAVAAGVGGLPFTPYLPTLQLAGSLQENVRAYALRDEQGNVHHAYRVVFAQNPLLGEYYGVEGTDWTNPPIIARPSQTVTLGRRSYAIVDDGSHIKLIAWRVGGALYWISNTLVESLTNRQMIALAQSARPLR